MSTNWHEGLSRVPRVPTTRFVPCRLHLSRSLERDTSIRDSEKKIKYAVLDPPDP